MTAGRVGGQEGHLKDQSGVQTHGETGWDEGCREFGEHWMG